MLPLSLFRNRQFAGANGTTLAVYAALGGAFFLLVLELQLVLGYSALEAGSALLPVTLLMLALSARAGALAQRIGPTLPMTFGPLIGRRRPRHLVAGRRGVELRRRRCCPARSCSASASPSRSRR